MQPEGYIKRYTSISSVIDMLSRRELALLDPQTWDDRNDRYYMGLYKEHSHAASLYAACFTQDQETYHHWRVFTGTSDGACIEIDRAKLEKHVAGTPNIRVGEVDYKTLKEIDLATSADRKNLPFLKRVGFGPELEFRVLAVSADPQGTVLGLPIKLDFIRRIYFNPWIPDTVYKSVKPLLESIDGCSHIRITRSQLIDSLHWKNAGNRIMGKPAMGKVTLPGASTPKGAPTKSKKSLIRKKPSTKKKGGA